MPAAMSFKQRLALRAYTLALRLLMPAILLRYRLRGRKEPGYRFAMRERLGFGAQIEPGSIWVHAVSLGETRAATALIDALRPDPRVQHDAGAGAALRRPHAGRAGSHPARLHGGAEEGQA